jgi:hypothetical protein
MSPSGTPESLSRRSAAILLLPSALPTSLGAASREPGAIGFADELPDFPRRQLATAFTEVTHRARLRPWAYITVPALPAPHSQGDEPDRKVGVALGDWNDPSNRSLRRVASVSHHLASVRCAVASPGVRRFAN